MYLQVNQASQATLSNHCILFNIDSITVYKILNTFTQLSKECGNLRILKAIVLTTEILVPLRLGGGWVKTHKVNLLLRKNALLILKPVLPPGALLFDVRSM